MTQGEGLFGIDVQIEMGGVPVGEVRFESLRERVAYVPQEGFLFDASVGANVRYGRPDATDDEVIAAATTARAAPG